MKSPSLNKVLYVIIKRNGWLGVRFVVGGSIVIEV